MKTFITIIFCLLSTLGIAQTTILFEDFNTGFPAGWQLIDDDGAAPYNDPFVNFINDAFVLTEDYDSTGIGDSILVATSWLDPITDANDFLILPAVTLGAGGNDLYFDTKSVDQSYPDGIQLLYTFNDLSVDTIMSSGVLFDTIAAPPYWTNLSVNLDTLGLQNQSVHFVFRHYGNDQYILGLDNIHIVINDPSYLDEESKINISLYPNPSNGSFNVQGLNKREEYKIYNLNGQLIQRGSVINTIHTDIEKGMYLLNIKNVTRKLLIE